MVSGLHYKPAWRRQWRRPCAGSEPETGALFGLCSDRVQRPDWQVPAPRWSTCDQA